MSEPAFMLRAMVIDRASLGFPPTLRAGDGPAIERLWAIGNLELLDRPLLALFCSKQCPGAAIVRSYDVARVLRDRGVPVIGGFHSPMEKDCLDILLRGTQPVVICPARGIERMRVPGAWRPGIAAGLILVLSPFPARQRRPTQALAEQRNRMVGALAARFLVAHAAPGSKTERLCRELLAAGKPGYIIDAQADRHLLAAGARVLDEPEMIGLWTEDSGKLLGGGKFKYRGQACFLVL